MAAHVRIFAGGLSRISIPSLHKHFTSCKIKSNASTCLESIVIHNISRAYCSGSSRENTEFPNLASGPGLEHFIANSTGQAQDIAPESAKETLDSEVEAIPYLRNDEKYGKNRKVYFETYGCQMNVNDTEIAWSILAKSGFVKTKDITDSDVALVMTCSIRDGAEQKIWNRLEYLKHLKRKRSREKSKPPFKIGILGCMAERLKTKLVEQEKNVDLVCGPDAYRDLPRMLALTESGQTAVNVLLSLDETYADVVPVRLNSNASSAFVSIMRGCDNMCSYCIVPFTRGRERSRPIDSILEEVRILADQGIKEVTLLGQNVNSYRDTTEIVSYRDVKKDETRMSKGFKTIYKPKIGGKKFSHLLDLVSSVCPEMRIRFTSPHPKDFPDEVLYLIRDRYNICNQIHLPAQSGSTRMLELMRRGYTREAYLDLVHHIRSIIPGIALSSDFIAGFCEEREEDHQLTVSLMKTVQYQFAFCFPYSMRQKTHAYHRLKDDVPEDVKKRRHMDLIDTFREGSLELNLSQIGQVQLVLTEGVSKRSQDDLAGRNCGNIKVIFPNMDIPIQGSTRLQSVRAGHFIAVEITGANSQVLKAVPLYHTTLNSFFNSSTGGGIGIDTKTKSQGCL